MASREAFERKAVALVEDETMTLPTITLPAIARDRTVMTLVYATPVIETGGGSWGCVTVKTNTNAKINPPITSATVLLRN